MAAKHLVVIKTMVIQKTAVFLEYFKNTKLEFIKHK